MQKVLIFGLGGIGGVYACALQAAKLCDVHVVARSNYQMVKDKGMRLISPLLGDSHVRFSGGWCILRFCSIYCAADIMVL